MIWLLAVVVFLCSWVITGLVRRYAIATSLLDVPNARSSHSAPTPRGGGVAIVTSFLAATAIAGIAGWVPIALVFAVCGAGALVAALGFVDDRTPLPARWRFLGHAIAAVWVLAWSEPLPPLPVLGVALDVPPVLAYGLLWLLIVWMINLFNFMDGIDGLASCEAIIVTGCGAFLWAVTGRGEGWTLAVAFACSSAGFLAWNFPPAKIFMGDAGSGFIGLVIATLALWCGHDQPVLLWSWFILIGCFMVDAVTTLLRRAQRRERIHVAHRLHAYQYASRRLGTHLPVTLGYTAINLFWLFPLAALVAFGHIDGVIASGIAYLPLIALAIHFKAGDRLAQGE